MAARSLIIDLLESPNGTLYGVLIAFFIVILTTGLYFYFFIDLDKRLVLKNCLVLNYYVEHVIVCERLAKRT